MMKDKYCYQYRHNLNLMFLMIMISIVLICFNSASESSKGIGGTSGTCGDSLTWVLEDNTLRIYGTGSMYDYSESYGPGWEAKKTVIENIVIENGATNIGDYTFASCRNLTMVSMPDTIKTIGMFAFQDCESLTEVNFSKELKSIGRYAFSCCQALQIINLPEKLETIDFRAFSQCGLLSLDIPSSVTSIGKAAFYLCEYMKTAHLPGSIDTVPYAAFEYCMELETVILDEGIKTIGERAFCGNGMPMKLKTIYIPSTMTKVEAVAFMNCDSLNDVYYNASKEEADTILVGNNNTTFTDATWHCTNGVYGNVGGTSGTCGDALTWILDNNTLRIYGTGSMYDYSESYGPGWEAKKTAIEKIVIENGATTIGAYTFTACRNLTKVSMPDTIKTIGMFAFQDCESLTEVNFSKELKSIGRYAFSYCQALQTINLPEKLETIDFRAFSQCGLLSLDIPSSVTSIGKAAFYLCEYMKTAHLPGSIDTVPYAAFEYCMELETVILDEGIKTIGERAFCGNGMPMKLKTIYIPSTMTKVEAVAFMNCDSLNDVYYNASKEKADAILIGNNNSNFTDANWLFSVGSISPDDPSLKCLVLPEDLLIIEEEAFAYTLANKIIVPPNIIKIENHAFYKCNNLLYIEFISGNIQISDNAIEECNGVVIICPSNSQLERWAISNGFIVLRR